MALTDCHTTIDQHGKELAEHGTALFPIACYQDDLTAAEVPWHWHDEMEAVVVTGGSVVFATDRERETLRAGDGCIINSGVLHGARKDGDGICRLHSIVFHPRLVGGSVESVFWQKYLLPITENRSFQILPLRSDDADDAVQIAHIERAWNTCVDEPPGYEFVGREELSRMIYRLRNRLALGTSSPSAKTMRDEQRIKSMLAYVREHLGGELCIQSIAASAAVSESECIRCFRNTIAVTPIQYVKQLRLQKAAELLTETDHKIVEIGAACGFQEMSYFAKIFREQYGMTPTQYRSNHESG